MIHFKFFQIQKNFLLDTEKIFSQKSNWLLSKKINRQFNKRNLEIFWIKIIFFNEKISKLNWDFWIYYSYNDCIKIIKILGLNYKEKIIKIKQFDCKSKTLIETQKLSLNSKNWVQALNYLVQTKFSLLKCLSLSG